jgi:hypothetical protein
VANQTLTITDSLDDGLEDSGNNWSTTGPSDLSSDSAASRKGWTFRLTSQIPSGATISKCYVRIYKLSTNSASFPWKHQIQNSNPNTNTRWSATNKPSAATLLTGAASSGDCIWAAANNAYWFGEVDQVYLNLTSDMQALVNSYGTLNVDAVVNVAGSDPNVTGNYTLCESSSDTNKPTMYIEWTGGAAQSQAPRTLHQFSTRNAS